MSKPKPRPWKEILASLEDRLPREKTQTFQDVFQENSGDKPPRGPRPWEEIRAGIRMRTAPSLLRKPMPSFFLGASFLANSMYPFWRGTRLMELYPNMCKEGPRSFQAWIRFANNLLNDDEYDCRADGYTTMYHLLIEPFALMDDLTAVPMPESGEEVQEPADPEKKHAG